MGDPMNLTRREAGSRLLGLAAVSALGATALDLSGCGAPSSKSNSTPAPASSIPAKPKSAQSLSILDVAGNLQLTKGMLDDFKSQHGDIVSSISTAVATAPELAGKIKAQEDAGRLSIDMVLTGTDGLAAGIAQNLWLKMTPDFDDRLTNMKNYLDPAAKMQELAQGYGVELVYYPSGPLLEYAPAKVATPPTSTDELLAWAKANPGKFQYAVPKNSGPGRTFLMGLPYILGDTDPKDPTNGWTKTWAYLAELGKYTGNYETGTSATMKNLANGTSWIIASTTGWDINPRVLGTVPNTAKIQTLKGWHWVNDAQFAVVPKGIDNDKLSAILNLLQFMLTPKEQAVAYDKGYFYPGPAVKDVTLSMAPASSQQALQQYGRPEYDQLISSAPNETSLPAGAQVTAFSLWDQKIGAAKK
jgi:putative spermidine/putrescine transport system substrate-binding protein